MSLPNAGFADMAQWVARHIRHAQLVEDEDRLAPYRMQLAEYLDGKRQAFDLPLDLRGTLFQRAVWQTLTTIPFGQTRSYSEIAHAIGRPSAVRAVGTANGQNPLPIIVPCHRVLGKDGSLTGFGGGLEMKAALLRLEGITQYS